MWGMRTNVKARKARPKKKGQADANRLEAKRLLAQVRREWRAIEKKLDELCEACL